MRQSRRGFLKLLGGGAAVAAIAPAAVAQTPTKVKLIPPPPLPPRAPAPAKLTPPVYVEQLLDMDRGGLLPTQLKRGERLKLHVLNMLCEVTVPSRMSIHTNGTAFVGHGQSEARITLKLYGPLPQEVNIHDRFLLGVGELSVEVMSVGVSNYLAAQSILECELNLMVVGEGDVGRVRQLLSEMSVNAEQQGVWLAWI
jgi:hypothetical protein